MTGLHTVKSVICVGCQQVIGWTYVYAYEESEKYKEGKFIVEREYMAKNSKNIPEYDDDQEDDEDMNEDDLLAQEMKESQNGEVNEEDPDEEENNYQVLVARAIRREEEIKDDEGEGQATERLNTLHNLIEEEGGRRRGVSEVMPHQLGSFADDKDEDE